MKRANKNDPRQKSLFEGATINIIMGSEPKKRSLDDGNPDQLSEFDFGLRRVLKKVLEHANKGGEKLDRSAIAKAMTAMLGRVVTKSNLDEWTAMSKVGRRISVDALKALCEVTDDWSALHYFVEACGFKALEPDLAACAEYGAKAAIADSLIAETKKLKTDLQHPDTLARLARRLTKEGRHD